MSSATNPSYHTSAAGLDLADRRGSRLPDRGVKRRSNVMVCILPQGRVCAIGFRDSLYSDRNRANVDQVDWPRLAQIQRSIHQIETLHEACMTYR